MKLQGQRREEPDLNITPLIDVVFLLLIFFMVSTTFKKESELPIRLPQAGTEAAPVQEPDTIRVVVDVHDVIYVQGQKLRDSRLATVEQAVREAGTDLEEPGLIIEADADARHQTVITVMDAARRLGLERVSISSRILGEEDS